MRGACLCGGVRFETRGEVRGASICHCSQCRKQSGHVWASATVASADLSVEGEVRWFRASDRARRGFCPACGAFLFWEAEGSGEISFALGAVDGPTDPRHLRDIFVPDAPPVPAGPLRDACLCGAVTVELDGDPGEITACHCTQCRKTSGHFAASFDTDEAALTWQARDTTEFTTPGGGQRGFCPTCGASLYFRKDGDFSVEAGVVDNPTGGRLTSHIFIADKGDYYSVET